MPNPKITFVDVFGNSTQREMTDEEAAQFLANADAEQRGLVTLFWFCRGMQRRLYLGQIREIDYEPFNG